MLPVWHRATCGLAAAALLLTAGCGAGAPAPQPYTAAELNSLDPGTALGGKPAPDFTLTDQFGQSVSLAQFRGKAVVLAFIDDQCTTICPLTGTTMVDARRLLGPAAARVQLLAINANPQHIQVATVAAYSRTHGLASDWLFLTGSEAQLRQVWSQFGISVQILQGAIDHTPALYVIGAHGHERRLFLSSSEYGVVPLEADSLAQAVAAVLPGHPTVAKEPPLTGAAITSPATALTLPPLRTGGTPLALGGSSSHLLAFFASWATGAASGLLALNAYTQGAGSRLPPPAAVVVQPVETSLAAAAALGPIQAGTLRYPVAVDATGRVADAYGVQDIPWLVLVQNGHILWSHDGWLPAAALQQQVQAALAAQPASAAAPSSAPSQA